MKQTPENKPNSRLRTVFSGNITSSELIRDSSVRLENECDNKLSVSPKLF